MTMPLTTDTLARIALDLQADISHRDRFQRLIQTLRQIFDSDASALLRYEQGTFIPLALDGLNRDVMGRRFRLSEHPRLEAIARAGDVVRFPSDSQLPDPYDGLVRIPGHEVLKVHACIGLPLFSNQNLIGALTLDGMNPHQFDHLDDQELALIGSLASAALANALLLEQLARQASSPAASLPSSARDESVELIGQSTGMQQLLHEIAVVAPTELNVLILGETGVGKELIAKAIHQQSARQNHPLIYLNCAALPDSVAESELFGHVKGAFTGAIHHRAGKFEQANHGTLFLDEIGELSQSLQAKLLRVLQYGDIQRIGDDNQLKVDVRVLAATNRDLKAEVLAGHFRADLYHRLSVFPVQAPPLRERADDIPLLVGYFAERCRATLGLESVSVRPSTLRWLSQQDWPGNVRELEHALHRAVVLARAEQGRAAVVLEEGHFAQPGEAGPQSARQSSGPGAIPGEGLKAATETFQRQMIERCLKAEQENWAATARRLKLDPGNLHRLAQRLGMK